MPALKINEEELLTVTDGALEHIKRIFERENPGPEQGLRLGVVGGGCSGLSYKIEFSDQKEKDTVHNLSGIKILVDLKSTIYLKGTVLDYKDGLEGKGFVFTNPNATNTCGCGESFSV